MIEITFDLVIALSCFALGAVYGRWAERSKAAALRAAAQGVIDAAEAAVLAPNRVASLKWWDNTISGCGTILPR